MDAGVGAAGEGHAATRAGVNLQGGPPLDAHPHLPQHFQHRLVHVVDLVVAQEF